MAEITTTHFQFVECNFSGSGKRDFKIISPCGETIGQIYYSHQWRQYLAEFYQVTRGWNYRELAEVTEFVKKLQKPYDAV